MNSWLVTRNSCFTFPRLTGVFYCERDGNSKEITFSRIICIEYCNYTSLARIQNVYYVKINLLSTYVNEMPIKCLKKYLSQNLSKCYLYIGFTSILFDFFSLNIIMCLLYPKWEKINLQLWIKSRMLYLTRSSTRTYVVIQTLLLMIIFTF